MTKAARKSIKYVSYSVALVVGLILVFFGIQTKKDIGNTVSGEDLPKILGSTTDSFSTLPPTTSFYWCHKLRLLISQPMDIHASSLATSLMMKLIEILTWPTPVSKERPSKLWSKESWRTRIPQPTTTMVVTSTSTAFSEEWLSSTGSESPTGVTTGPEPVSCSGTGRWSSD